MVSPNPTFNPNFFRKAIANSPVPLERIGLAEKSARIAIREKLPDLCQRIEAGEKLTASDRQAVLNLLLNLKI